MVYAVIDSNVLVSALWTDNLLAPTRIVLDLLASKKITPLYCEEIIVEYRDVLNRPKFPFDEQDVENLIHFIVETGVGSVRTSFDGIMPDEEDRVFYEVSLSKEEAFLVTGNLKHFPQTPQVVTPTEFLEQVVSLLNN